MAAQWRYKSYPTGLGCARRPASALKIDMDQSTVKKSVSGPCLEIRLRTRLSRNLAEVSAAGTPLQP